MGNAQHGASGGLKRCFRSSAVAMSLDILRWIDVVIRIDDRTRYEEGPCQLLGHGSG